MTQRTREPAAAAGAAGDSRAATSARLAELFRLLAAGRTRALDGVYDACADEIYGLALWRTGSPDDAADVVQEVFVRLAAQRSRLSAIRDPLAYLRRMAQRASVDVHRRRARRREAPLEECAFVEASGVSPEQRLEAERISGLLAKLPASMRQAIFLRHFSGCSFAEIGRATGVPTFTAASRYRLGMRRLKRLAGVRR